MLESKRLTLRPIEPQDNLAVFKYRSDSETNKYQGWIPSSLYDVDKFIAKRPLEFNSPETWFQLAIVDKKSKVIIGDVGIHFVDSENHQCELGCTLSKEFHGNGFATEALSATIDYLFVELNKHRIVTSIDPENASSIRLVERLGFQKEAHFRESLLIDGRWVDDIVYAILSREWRNQNT